MNSLLKGNAKTLETKWVRVMAPGEATDLHSDFYRFAKFPNKLFTCWIPLGYFQKKWCYNLMKLDKE